MGKLLTRIPWRRLLLILAGGLVTYLVVPVTATRYSEIRELRDARLTRAIEFSTRNNDFNSKVNVTATMLRMYASHNFRMKVAGADFLERRKELVKDYRERRLELDGAAWWWPSQFAREAEALRLLTPEELKQLIANVEQYNASVLATINQITYLWEYLDSPSYKLNDESEKKINELKATMDKEFQAQYNIRQDVVRKIVALFEESRCRAGWRDLVGLPSGN